MIFVDCLGRDCPSFAYLALAMNLSLIVVMHLRRLYCEPAVPMHLSKTQRHTGSQGFQTPRNALYEDLLVSLPVQMCSYRLLSRQLRPARHSSRERY